MMPTPDDPGPESPGARWRETREARYWQRARRVSTLALLAWAVVTATAVALPLDVQAFGWPLAHWFSTQVALIAFVAIVWIYALAMDHVEDERAADRH